MFEAHNFQLAARVLAFADFRRGEDLHEEQFEFFENFRYLWRHFRRPAVRVYAGATVADAG